MTVRRFVFASASKDRSDLLFRSSVDAINFRLRSMTGRLVDKVFEIAIKYVLLNGNFLLRI